MSSLFLFTVAAALAAFGFSWGLSFGRCFFSVILFTVVVIILWLDELPLLFFLDGKLERSVVIASSVITNASVPPEVVHTHGAKDDIGVVKFVVVADPGADQAPHGLPGGVRSEAGHLGGFAAYSTAAV